jgi:hypothetical protein
LKVIAEEVVVVVDTEEVVVVEVVVVEVVVVEVVVVEVVVMVGEDTEEVTDTVEEGMDEDVVIMEDTVDTMVQVVTLLIRCF